jgi:hypothetical protein
MRQKFDRYHIFNLSNNLRACPAENHAKYQKSSKRVVAIYDFFYSKRFLHMSLS